MSYRLIIFPTPLDATCTLTHDDDGITRRGFPVVHPSGRKGQGFELPSDLPNGHGARLLITAPKKVPLDQRGTVYVNDGVIAFPWTPGQMAAFVADDFLLADAASALPRLVRNGLFLAQEIP